MKKEENSNTNQQQVAYLCELGYIAEKKKMKPLYKMFLPAMAVLAAACSPAGFTDVGQGYGTNALFAPWDGLQDDTRFCCHSTADRFFFSFEVTDTTICLSEPFLSERDVEPEDRVEVFFCPLSGMEAGYHCAEIDPEGRIMDYSAKFYRDFDYGWDFKSMEAWSSRTPWGYRVAGSVLRSELEDLGLNLEKGFLMGVFRADFKPDGSVNWYSLVPTADTAPDFHKPDVLFRCTMNPKPERRGVVVYPNDITSVGLEEWENRIRLSGINLIGLHAATVNDPIDTLEAFVRSTTGQSFLKLCSRMGVDVEYELHALQFILPRDLYDSHPEYFRQDPEGERQQQYNMCFTSAEAVEAMRPQIENLLEWMKPTTHRYFFWTDDKQGKFCFCDECSGYSPSEQALIYENRLLEMLREYDPEATLAHLAYHQTVEPPVKVRADEGIFLEFAPINRDYSLPLPMESSLALKENLLAFPACSQHILEYWLDESMFSGWKRDRLVPMPFKEEECARDIWDYRRLGSSDMTTFATWLYGDYIEKYGSTDRYFKGYGHAFGNASAPVVDTRNAVVVSEYEDLMAHCSTYISIGDTVYVAYYHDQTQAYEHPKMTTITPVLAKMTYPDFLNIERTDIMRSGMSVGSFTQSPDRAPYDPNLLRLGDRLMCYFIGCIGEEVTYCVRPYDLKKAAMEDTVEVCTLTYEIAGRKKTVAASANALFDMYEEMGISAARHNDILMTGRFIEYGGEYYCAVATAFTPSSKPVVVKTRNGVDFDVVRVCTEHLCGACEASVEIWRDNLYVIVRNSGADLGYRGTFLYKYDMKGNCLAGPVFLTAAQSKPSLIVYKDRLYAFYTADPWIRTDWGNVSRSRLRVSEIDGDCAVISSRDVVSEFGIHYIYPGIFHDEVWMTFTEDRKKVDIAQTRSNVSFAKVNL